MRAGTGVLATGRRADAQTMLQIRDRCIEVRHGVDDVVEHVERLAPRIVLTKQGVAIGDPLLYLEAGPGLLEPEFAVGGLAPALPRAAFLVLEHEVDGR